MNRFMLEGLEHRSLLSASLVDTEPMLVQAAPPVVVRAAAKASNYICQGKLGPDQVAGNFVLRLSIAGTKVTGSMYSSAWGGFSTTVSGTLSAGKLSISGKSTNFQLRSLKANVSSAGVISKNSPWAVTQVGIKAAGIFSATKISTPPAPAAAVAPKVAGRYNGSSLQSDGKLDKNVPMIISRQSGGLVWGTIKGATMSGIVLADGRILMMRKNSEGTDVIKGKYTASTKTITGAWSWTGTNGDHENGTFKMKRV